MGAKKAPFYRIVAIDSRKSRDGQYIEQIGYYNPVKQPPDLKIDAELAKKWLSVGAQPTDTVRDLFFKAGIIADKKKVVVQAAQTDAPIAPIDEIKDAVDAAVKAHITE